MTSDNRKLGPFTVSGGSWNLHAGLTLALPTVEPFLHSGPRLGLLMESWQDVPGLNCTPLAGCRAHVERVLGKGTCK